MKEKFKVNSKQIETTFIHRVSLGISLNSPSWSPTLNLKHCIKLMPTRRPADTTYSSESWHDKLYQFLINIMPRRIREEFCCLSRILNVTRDFYEHWQRSKDKVSNTKWRVLLSRRHMTKANSSLTNIRVAPHNSFNSLWAFVIKRGWRFILSFNGVSSTTLYHLMTMSFFCQYLDVMVYHGNGRTAKKICFGFRCS